jgi:hypothetical protein
MISINPNNKRDKMMSDRAEIVEYGKDGNPQIQIDIGDKQYGFSVKSVPAESRMWLLSVVDRQMTEIHDRAVIETKLSMQKEFKKMFGITD